MELEFDVEKECKIMNELILYKIKPLLKNKTLCGICQLDEKETLNDKKIFWERYKLSCGHIFHTRCFRRHCYHKDNIECPYRCILKKANYKII